MATQHFYMGADEFIMTPGARLSVGPTGRPYESLGEDQAIAAKSNAEAAAAAAEFDTVAAAKRELAKMKSALKSWLKYRQRVDEVATGKRKGKVPPGLAAKMMSRDYEGEKKLAKDLWVLLSEMYDTQSLPDPNQPNAAVALAKITIAGELGKNTEGPQAQGFIPILIVTVGAVLLLSITTFIKNRAEVQKEKERLECIKVGACTDTGKWVKIAVVGAAVWFAWEKLGVKEWVAKKRGGSRK